MRLKKIKLSGFKSFVDPITIPMEGDLIGIVGPNGCGKSNIIDAVRWVMGESSAKHLRGDSMADVIFSGSNSRKPVGKASVELVFDNTDGKAPGQYASYAEISIRREGSRDGTSDYFLNKTRCRRKDITGLFLGTGLGPRAYAIIEQGMITRIIESKPEELRWFLEEAAGISRYKERRRETETRIRHTRENLDRVEDIRKELGDQLKRLSRQSKAAAKYKGLKEDERRLKSELLALRWQEATGHVQEHDLVLSGKETKLEGAMADKRAVEAGIEQIRQQQTEANDQFNSIQAEYYSVGAEIAGLEQSIQHARETLQQRLREQEELNRTWSEASENLQSDLKQLERLSKRLEESQPKLHQAIELRDNTGELLRESEESMRAWQQDWDEFSVAATEPAKARDIENTRANQLQHQIEQLQEREQRLRDELAGIEDQLQGEDVAVLREQSTRLENAVETQEKALEATEQSIAAVRKELDKLQAAAEAQRGEEQRLTARLESLNELQAAAQGDHDKALNEWLHRRGLANLPRLSAVLTVEAGWEQAVEQVFGDKMAAVCVQDLSTLAPDLAGLDRSRLTLIDIANGNGQLNREANRPLLADKIRTEANLDGFLGGIYTADSLEEALGARGDLAGHESIVTRNGQWVGPNWLSLAGDDSDRSGILARTKEIEQLGDEIDRLQQQLLEKQQQIEGSQQQLSRLEQNRQEQRQQLNERNRERATFREQLGHKEARLIQLTERCQQINAELSEIGQLGDQAGTDHETARQQAQVAAEKISSFDTRRAALQQARESLRKTFDDASRAFNQARDTLHEIEIERQSIQTAFESTQQGVTRLEGQLKHLIERRQELGKLLTENKSPEDTLKQRLEESLQMRLQVEERLNNARKQVSELESQLREKEQARNDQDQRVQEIRQELEQERMARQELIVRRQTIEEQIDESGAVLNQVISDMPEEAELSEWQERLEKIDRRITRLGPINLVAIEEFEEQSERKVYLDKQYDDLQQALSTLEEAIHKIDRETRMRFKDTYEQVNEGLGKYFPKLFGGGKAYLEMTSDNLLDTGITVMARPPGKRNTNIHLLSGGEKSLTAVALLFSLFELNPAPFCFLDEVDAPLDDANVSRYSEILRNMSKKTQLVYVTHNKITMEISDIMLGVTMSEPGVSRLVAVDVDEALEMVAQ